MESFAVALGAGIYWASNMSRLLTIGPVLSGENVQSIAAIALSVILLLASPYLTKRHVSGLARIALALSILNLIMTAVPATIFTDLSSLPGLAFVLYLASPILMLLWGVQFAGVDRAQAFSEVAKTSFVALGMQAILIASAPLFVTFPQAFAATGPLLSTCSAAILVSVSAKRPIRVEAREFNTNASKTITLFIISRILIGLLMGAILAEVALRATGLEIGNWPTLPPLIVCLIALAALALPNVRASLRTYLPLMPLAVAPLFSVLAFPNESFALYFLYAGTWFAWIVMSSVQLSELKYTFGMNELSLVFLEKTLMVLSMLIGRLIMIKAAESPCFEGMLSSADTPAFAHYALWFIPVLAACFYSSRTLLGLSNMRSHEDIVRQVVTEQDDELGYIYHSIACEYGLSAREEELFRYLAKGHTRSFISNELEIAPGTVKSHIGHIYHKLGCHTKEDVIALVNERKTFNR